ncbi:MAG: hypothetical protein KF753_05010 [Caldilineaceae bacterium]|nr:hypothetical protein [Caldilineaceae bacterium]
MSESGAGLKAAFRAMWHTYGRPRLSIYEPISGWTLPAGVTYDSTQDRFEDGDGDEVAVDYTDADIADVTLARYVPVTKEERQAVQMGDGSAFEQPGLRLRVEYTAAIDTALDSNWAIGVGGTLYRLTDRTKRKYLPVGAGTPVLIEVELMEQVSDYA